MTIGSRRAQWARSTTTGLGIGPLAFALVRFSRWWKGVPNRTYGSITRSSSRPGLRFKQASGARSVVPIPRASIRSYSQGVGLSFAPEFIRAGELTLRSARLGESRRQAVSGAGPRSTRVIAPRPGALRALTEAHPRADRHRREENHDQRVPLATSQRSLPRGLLSADAEPQTDDQHDHEHDHDDDAGDDLHATQSRSQMPAALSGRQKRSSPLRRQRTYLER